MAELIANSLDDYLMDGIAVKLAKTMTYAINRKSCTSQPQSSNILINPTHGTKLIKFQIARNDLLNQSTFRIMF